MNNIRSTAGNETNYIINNPGSRLLQLTHENGINHMRIMDMNGRNVLTKQGPLSLIPLDKIPAGIYVVRFETAAEVSCEKLIVK